ncbi:hypothetical protein LIER_32837 [Lithospermum erythrorhizon]|uniref:Uncharacterized protein n=1 Tax=Lithospermum erythrorhizon TaxID=34254 RepID=A0AAV3RX82_LITER
MGRAPCCDKANVKKGPWAPEEDVKLKDYIQKNGTGGNWIALPQKIGLKRCGKSCRLRWLNYLRPNIKHGGFTEDEDKIICSLYISIGSRWSVIAAQLPGRTDNDIKNYWNTRLKKKLLGKRKQTLMDRLSSLPHHHDLQKDANEGVEDNPYLQNLSNSAIERLQLHMQLQSSFSFYNNPVVWPNRSSPPQENMTQNMQSMNGGQISMFPQVSPSPQRSNNNMKVQEFEDVNIGFPPSMMAQKTSSIQEQDVNAQMISTFTQAELDELLINTNKNGGFLPPSGSQMAVEFDCFKEMEGPGSKDDQLLWWSNDFDTNSRSSSSWDDSTSLVYPSGEMCQGLAVGYNNNNVHQLH